MPFSCDLIHCTEGKLDCYNESDVCTLGTGRLKDQSGTRQNPSEAGEWSPPQYILGWNHSEKFRQCLEWQHWLI